LAPQDQQIRKNLSGMLTDWAIQAQEQGQSQRAEELLKEAVEHDADNGLALVLLGNAAYLRKDGLEAAIGYWKRAFAVLPASQRSAVSDRIAQAERDRSVERAFASHQTPHFIIRFEGDEFGDEAQALGGLLEQQRARLEASLGSGPNQLTVLLYTRGSFERVAGRRDWALGLYDGRIRLRVEELRAEFVANVIAHELTHAWLFEGFGPRLPTWLHEGLAQYHEPDQRLHEQQQALLNGIASRSSWVPLRWIDRRFEQPSNMEDLERAYLQSRWAVDALIGKHGRERFRKFLQQLSAGKPMDRAFDEAFAPSRWARFDQGSLE
jgi:tetratricopeptide (TPR) repeat protein